MFIELVLLLMILLPSLTLPQSPSAGDTSIMPLRSSLRLSQILCIHYLEKLF
jgi:hypothetical protein